MIGSRTSCHLPISVNLCREARYTFGLQRSGGVRTDAEPGGGNRPRGATRTCTPPSSGSRGARARPASNHMDILYWLLFVVFIAALLVLSGVLLRGYFTTGSPRDALKEALAGNFFGPRPPKRLAVVDQANVDGRRKLLLIRRDGVEHLIMTGGPVDVVIETGIQPPELPESDLEAAEPVFQRRPRTLSGAVVEA